MVEKGGNTAEKHSQAEVTTMQLSQSVEKKWLMEMLQGYGEQDFQKVTPHPKFTRDQKTCQSKPFSTLANVTHCLNGGKVKLKMAQRNDQSSGSQENQKVNSKQGLMYWSVVEKDDTDGEDQLKLPKEYRELALKMAQVKPMPGHLGHRKTTHGIQKIFFWPEVHQDVLDLCRR